MLLGLFLGLAVGIASLPPLLAARQDMSRAGACGSVEGGRATLGSFRATSAAGRKVETDPA